MTVQAPIYDAITIADELLQIAKRHGQALSPMKLMKLTYIAHGWALAILGRDLFQNRIEAWKYGPVIPDLYRATKRFGSSDIPLAQVGEQSAVDPQTKAFLEDVYRKYGGFTAIQLSTLTHQSGTPWDQVYVDGEFNTEIPDGLIRAHYESLLRDSQPA